MPRTVDIVVLGSGGAVPRARMQPAILVRDWMGNTILLDAGEAVQTSLFRVGVSPSSLDLIAITHPHGDHVNGLAGLLMTMSLEGRRRPLTIVSTRDVLEFAGEVLEATRSRLGFEVKPMEAAGEGSLVIASRGGDRLTLSWAPACHTVEAVGFRLTWSLRPRLDRTAFTRLGLRPGPWVAELLKSGSARVSGREVTLEDLGAIGGREFSIAYTGDTSQPCNPLKPLLKGADIVIHDSTLDSSLRGEARERGHSTAIDAASEARKAGARLLILAHVSSRYEGLEARRLLLEARQAFKQTLMAWDGARIKVNLG